MTTVSSFKSHRILGAAAEAGARRKRAEYHGHHNQGQFTFRPLALELPGRLGKDFTGFFDDVCKKARDLHGLNANEIWVFRLILAQQAVCSLHTFARLASGEYEETDLSALPVHSSARTCGAGPRLFRWSIDLTGHSAFPPC